VRFGIKVGLAIGVATVLVLGWGIKTLAGYGDPKVYSMSCRGAQVVGTISLYSSSVVVQVSIVDPKERAWVVNWDQYAEEQAQRRLPWTSSDDTGVLSTAATLGDTDDGDERTVLVKPNGETAWCTLDMHVDGFF
jgi:hypothetical protein